MSEEKSLVQIIDKKKASIEYATYTYDIDWFVQKIKNERINISPEYQRSFEWSIEQQSRFIESLILNMPIPPIYMVENDEGSFDLLDGLQRLSTILYFLNEVPSRMTDLRFKLNVSADEKLNTRESKNYEEEEESILDFSEIEKLRNSSPSFKLKGCDIIEALNGKSFNDLELKIQTRLMNKAINVYVYTNQDFKYHMFNRMNGGGTELSSQQQLNSTLRLIDSRFINFIGDTANSKFFFDFVILYNTPEKSIRNKGMFLEEMLLRFIAMSFESDKYKKDITPFLEKVATQYTTEWKDLSDISYKQKKESLEKILKHTFEKLSGFALGKGTFTLNGKKNFNLVEAVVCHLIQCPEVLENLTKQNYENFLSKVAELDQKESTSPFSGGGKNTIKYFKTRLRIVDEAFKSASD
jgi:uncharacterized protein with ParB-like and HNH nuclease domain